VVAAVGTGAKQQLDEIDRKLEEQRCRLSESSSGDERRSITETVRHVRQEVARLRFHPDHRGRYLEHKLNDLITRYNDNARPERPTPQSERFDQQALAALKAYPSGSGSTKCCCKEGGSVIEQIAKTTALGSRDDRFSALLA
jgi:hypothetical protein